MVDETSEGDSTVNRNPGARFMVGRITPGSSHIFIQKIRVNFVFGEFLSKNTEHLV